MDSSNKQSYEKFRIMPIRTLFPNMITLTALCAGMSSIRASLNMEWDHAISFIVLAAFLDGMDGRIARLLKATSNFGAQLDSLADFLNFGVAPSFLLYQWKLQQLSQHSIGWAISLFFSVCMALRLARFNASLDDKNLPSWRERFFVGVPAPVAGCLALSPVMISIQQNYNINANLISVYSLILAILMISRVPTFSIKKLAVKRENTSIVMILASVIITSLIIKPWMTIMILCIIYLCSIPFSIYFYIKLKQQEKL